MNAEAFNTLNQIFYLVVAGHRTLASLAGVNARTIETTYTDFISLIQRNGELAIQQIAQQLRSGWGWYSYMPPESRGAIIRSVVDAFNQPRNAANDDLRSLAAFTINEMMATTQSIGHLDNTLDRITVAMGEAPGRNQGAHMIDSVVAGTMFADSIARCAAQVGKADPLMGRPFLRNDEPEFQLAQFPLHHPGFTVC